MMTNIVRYGMIGCGMMGQEHLKNIALLPDTVVSAIFEPDLGMREIAKSLAPQATFCASINDLLMRDDVDCLVIVSPNHMHLSQLEDIANTKHRPILVEKPLFTSVADIDRIARFKENYRAPVWVAMEYRYMPPVQALRDQMAQAVGDLKMITIREHRFPFLEKVGDWNRFNENSGGTFVEKCCHFFDLMRLLSGSDPVRVMATGGQGVNHLDEVYDGKTSDIWDHGYVIVDFANGVRAMLELCMFAEGATYQEEISAVGSQGKIEALVPGPTRFWPTETLGTPPTPKIVVSPRDTKGPVECDIPVDPALLAAGDHNGSTFYQHQNFLEVVKHWHAPEVGLIDGIWAVRMGQAAQISAQTGRAITFEDGWKSTFE
jgi:myo-inositol 2-dehydrogenase/D-chiro-inositol 1-dehydrogenase